MAKLLNTLLISILSTSLFASDTIELTLKDAISYALKNNHQSKISKLALEVADAQYKQAMSANYPSLDFDVTASRKDEPSNFRLNGDITLDAQTTKDLAFLRGFKAASGVDHLTAVGAGNAAAAAAPTNSALPLDTNVKVLGRDTIYGKLQLTYPLYTGGKISAIIEQARLNKTIKKQDIKLQDDEIIFNVKKIYLSYILASKIYKSTQDTFLRMKLVRKLTKELFEGESLNVKKTDFLKTNLTVTMMEAELNKQKANIELTKSALKNVLAVPYDKKIKILDEDFSYKVDSNILSLDELYTQATLSNPLINKIKLALKVAKEKIKESKSAYLPTVALFADTTEFYNSMNGGLNTSENENSWTVGVNASINIFDGFKNENEILEQRLKKKELNRKNRLLEDAIAFQLNEALLENQKSFSNIQSYEVANEQAIEHRALNIKAYRIDMAETKDVIEAQIIEVRTKAMYYQAVYDYLLSLAKISKIVGREI